MNTHSLSPSPSPLCTSRLFFKRVNTTPQRLGVLLMTLVGLSGALTSCQNGTSSNSYFHETRKAPAAAPANRPGLATQAGRYEYQSTEDTTFFRHAPARPDFVETFHYNDREGVAAQMPSSGSLSTLRRGWIPCAQGKVEFCLESEGRKLPYWQEGAQAIFMGEQGNPYQMRLRNTSASRVEVVISVDSIDTLTLGPASLKNRGYVIEPGDAVTVKGFRESDRNVREFLFGSVRNSVATAQGRSRNVGVIGLGIFVEDTLARQQAMRQESDRRQAAKAF